MNISLKNAFIYNQCFSPCILNEFVYKRYPKRLLGLLDQLGKRWDQTYSYAGILDEIYLYLSNHYRYAYIYKNEIFIKEILNFHSVEHTLLTEIGLKDTRLDMLILNGTTTAYEIKSEFDSIQRLYYQLSEYIQIFDKVYVVCSKKNLDDIQKFVTAHPSLASVGIKYLTEELSIKESRAARSGLELNILSKNMILETINSSEYETADFCDKFLSQDIQTCHDIFLNILKQRYSAKPMFLEKLPNSLKIAGTKMKHFNIRQKEKFIERINQPYFQGVR